MGVVYIIQSEATGRFYVGSTDDLNGGSLNINAARALQREGEVHGNWFTLNGSILLRKQEAANFRSKRGSPRERSEH
jgi:hypothetical protein